MCYVVLYRNLNSGRLGYICDSDQYGEAIDDRIAEFKTLNDVNDFVSKHRYLNSGQVEFQITRLGV